MHHYASFIMMFVFFFTFNRQVVFSEEVKAVAMITYSDSIVEVTINFKDDTPLANRRNACNRCYATVNLTNKSSEEVVFTEGFAQFNWVMESLSFETVPLDAKQEGEKFHAVPLTQFGTRILRIIPARSLTHGVESGVTQSYDVDLGRVFDMSLTLRYFLSGSISYRTNGQEKKLVIGRVPVIAK